MFHVLLKPGLENFEHYFASMWNECSCGLTVRPPESESRGGLRILASSLTSWGCLGNLLDFRKYKFPHLLDGGGRDLFWFFFYFFQLFFFQLRFFWCGPVWAFFGIAFVWDWNEIPKKLFQSCGHCWVFQICWHIECSTFTASSFRIWNSSTGTPSPPLALFVVMLSKAHLTSHSRMSGSRWVITPSWLSGSWRSFFVQFFCVFLPPLLNIFCFF